jgi:hypothetical protein
MNIWGAERALRQLGQEDLRSATVVNRAWLSQFASFTLRHLVQRLGNTDRQDELRLEFGPRGQQHLLEVLNAWGSIQAAVKVHALTTEWREILSYSGGKAQKWRSRKLASLPCEPNPRQRDVSRPTRGCARDPARLPASARVRRHQRRASLPENSFRYVGISSRHEISEFPTTTPTAAGRKMFEANRTLARLAARIRGAIRPTSQPGSEVCRWRHVGTF